MTKKAIAGFGNAIRSVSWQSTSSKLRDYYILTKPEVNLLILMTTSAGYYLAARSSFNLSGLAFTLIGTLLVASGTATLNQLMERRHDARMRRTARRPIPLGRVGKMEALCFGVVLSIVGTVELWMLVNPLAALLAIATLLTYLLLYTPLKRETALCTLVGAFPGAMPVLIGWAGATAKVDGLAWFLYSIVFLWQFPHFLAIALMYREDYAGAGYRMLPQFDADGRFTRAEIVSFTVALVALTLTPVFVGAGDFIYYIGAVITGVLLLVRCAKLALSGARVEASRLLHASIIYLPLLLFAMILGRL